MSTLSRYLSVKCIKQADFAVIVGASQGTISKLINGAVLPSLDLAVKIELATSGAVSASGWITNSRKDAVIGEDHDVPLIERVTGGAVPAVSWVTSPAPSPQAPEKDVA